MMRYLYFIAAALCFLCTSLQAMQDDQQEPLSPRTHASPAKLPPILKPIAEEEIEDDDREDEGEDRCFQLIEEYFKKHPAALSRRKEKPRRQDVEEDVNK